MNASFLSVRAHPNAPVAQGGLHEHAAPRCRGSICLGVGDGRLLFRLVALGLMGAGCFALIQSATGRFLPHDLRYLRMNAVELCGLGRGRIALFMFHDRVSFGGALIAIGVLYAWLEGVPLRAGEAWAWWAFLLSGVTGFGSFLAYLGYGYLAPAYVGALIFSFGIVLCHKPMCRFSSI